MTSLKVVPSDLTLSHNRSVTDDGRTTCRQTTTVP